MNLYAYHPNDPTRAQIHIDNWVVQYGVHTDGRCKVCHNSIYVRAEKTQKQTHFAHYQNSECPTIKTNHQYYVHLTNQPKDPQLAAAAKQWVSDNLCHVFETIKSILDKRFYWWEFHSMLKTANELDIWSIQGMPHYYIPYVLLMCKETFEANQYGRKQSCYFVLETTPSTGAFVWNDPAAQKKYLWQITLPNRDVIEHEITDNTATDVQKAIQLLS
ncbi:hypothetical protein M5236_004106 [Vibrio parahaemolyticus]|nr:hypothetical protein [Vibrio parahaemolyticus]